MPVKAVLFDCDGVLVDSEPLSRRVLLEMLDEQGIDPALGERLDSVSGQRISDSLSDIMKWSGKELPQDFLTRYREREYALLAERVKPVPGIFDALDSLDLARAVVSNGPLEKLRITLGKTGLWARFAPHVYSAYEIDRHKPDPGLYRHAAAMLGVEPAACVVVEDSAAGALSGFAAGMQVVGYGPQRGALANLGAVQLQDMAHLPELIVKLAS